MAGTSWLRTLQHVTESDTSSIWQQVNNDNDNEIRIKREPLVNTRARCAVEKKSLGQYKQANPWTVHQQIQPTSQTHTHSDTHTHTAASQMS